MRMPDTELNHDETYRFSLPSLVLDELLYNGNTDFENYFTMELPSIGSPSLSVALADLANAGRFDMLHVRPYSPNDREFVLSLAPRLTIGMQPWRDQKLWLATVENWLSESINQHDQKTTVLIAEDEQNERWGFVTVSHSAHFTGQPQAYIGELATVEIVEGRGVGSALVEACEHWAREHGYALLTLSTGAGNERALRFYHHLGFQDEDITLTKLL